MKSMFCECNSLKNIKMNNFDTRNVINMSAMFQNCSKLYDLSLSFLNINNAENIVGIFHGCQRNFIGKNGKIFKDY